MEFDLLIKNITIVDGTGKQPYKGSIGVIGERVAAIGEVTGDAMEEINGIQLTAAPGFIDAHSHADLNLRFFPECESYLLQGITTFIGGNCGFSPAPLGDKISLPSDYAAPYIDQLIKYKYYPEVSRFPREQVNEIMEKNFGWTVDWHTMGDFFKAIEKVGISCNYAPLIGHGTCRSLVLGEMTRRKSSNEEIKEIKTLLRNGLEDGCIGISIGLDYPPGVFSSREELVECISLAKEYDGVFSPHMRRTGLRRGMSAGHRLPNMVNGLLEVIDITRATGVRMQISHLGPVWSTNPRDGPSILEEATRKATLSIIDSALEEGLDISFDSMPSAALPGKLRGWSYISELFEPWVREKVTRNNFAEWLKVKEYREEIKEAIKQGKWFMRVAYNPNTNPEWAKNITILEHKNHAYVDKTIHQIAEEKNQDDQLDVYFDLMIEDPDGKQGLGYPGAVTDEDESYKAIFYQHPASSVGLDAWGVNYDSMHPPVRRSGREMMDYAGFVGFIEKFVKQMKVLTIEEAVHKTSTQAAQRYNLKDRGVISEGSYADIVLMDLENLKVMGTPLEPRKQPKGIEYVIVNGVKVVENARHTGLRPGKIFKRERV